MEIPARRFYLDAPARVVWGVGDRDIRERWLYSPSMPWLAGFYIKSEVGRIRFYVSSAINLCGLLAAWPGRNACRRSALKIIASKSGKESLHISNFHFGSGHIERTLRAFVSCTWCAPKNI
ncbi:hypothetical protein [Lysobacter sp. Hz 25]|uniref:hypothetical protein n=1 Tax=Lysobacter sp. Hz 25 TaxID=3383698 RepID=UPI0038D47DDA